ncbi:CD44 protein, partial [Smithornis capensis]|nr:CD44 protein [Smithornis capensis]
NLHFFSEAIYNTFLISFSLTTEFNVSCRYGGVFHVEKNGRYSLTRSEAVELCRALNSTLATLEQLKKAHELGFETCRYGFIVGHIVIPRINPHHVCAANHTGIYKLSANTTARYDAYCYNGTETRDKACEPIEKLDTSFLSNQDEIGTESLSAARTRPCGLGLHGRFNITADVTSSGNGSDDEDSSEETVYPTVFAGWGRTMAKDETAPSTSKELPFSLDGFFLLFLIPPDVSSRSTSSIYDNEGPRKGHDESTAFPGETTTTKIASQPRSATVPEWLIIVAALVALALVLAVCIAVNSRRRCGQKKKLVINNGKGPVEDRKTSELNGDVSKSQEMVHLVHKEQSNDQTQACDEFLTVNETQNHQDLDMKTGV